MTPYFCDASGNRARMPFGNITIDHMTAGVGIDGVAGVVTLRVSRPGWVSPAVKLGHSPYFITNSWKPNTYSLEVTVGKKTTPFKFTIAPVPTTPIPTPTPPPVTPPEPQPVPQPAGSDPRTDYPVAFPYSSLPQDAQGWTIFNPSIDSKIFHVAPTGSDANDGTESKPLKTVAKAMSLARSGYPDQILLQCGGSYGKVGQWTKGGRSKTEPMVLGSYGTGPRPIIGQIYSSEGATINNFAMVGIHVYAKDRDYTAPGFDLAKVQDQQYGLDWFASGSGIHFEDCRISFWWYNVYLHGGQVVFRRNIVDHAWTKSGEKAQGMYISGGPTLKENGPSLTLEENVIHHNGWAEFKDGAPPKGNKMGVWTFSHGIYTAEHCGPILYRRNIVTRNANNGINGRSGGVLEGNLGADNSSQMYVGRMASKANENKPCWIIDNVCVNAEHGNGFGLETPFWYAGKVEDNIVANHGTNASNGFAIRLDPARTEKYIPDDPSAHTPSSSTIDFNRNTFYRAGMIKVWANGPSMVIRGSGNYCDDPAGVILESGTQGKQFAVSKTGTFADPTRDLAKYHASIGGAASVESFASEACKQSKQTWRAQYTTAAANAWIRKGFV